MLQESLIYGDLMAFLLYGPWYSNQDTSSKGYFNVNV